eukprot:Nitzschia sp. Nitz4//scaffold27_size158506//61224//64947//NITZ4_002597-RA/size158506-processed-gene-0.15-mRNA-1//1//CDS//3329545479//7834//frame0
MVTETSRLLSSNQSSEENVQPCNYSNRITLPMTSSYKDLHESMESQLQAYKEPTKSKHHLYFTPQAAVFLLLIGCAICVLFVSFIGLNPLEDSHTSHRTQVIDDQLPLHGKKPFSLFHPVHDLGIASFERPHQTAPPPDVFVQRHLDVDDDQQALPTNAWYQNLLMVRGEPSNLHRAYPMPYLVDTIGSIPGIRVHSPHVMGSSTVMQMEFNELFGLTLGAAPDTKLNPLSTQDLNALSHQYHVLETTDLGLTMEWNVANMSTTIVKGMPYSTMEYADMSNSTWLPTIAGKVGLTSVAVDGAAEIQATAMEETTVVESELVLHFEASDFTWMIFFSEPVRVRYTHPSDNSGATLLQVVGTVQDSRARPFILRAALLNSCTNGRNPNGCRPGIGGRLEDEDNVDVYANLLRKHAPYFPGRYSSVSYEVEDDIATIVLDWDVQTMGEFTEVSANDNHVRRSLEQHDDIDNASLLAYALPHHVDTLTPFNEPDGVTFCRSSLHGPVCLVEGNTWTLTEELPRIGLQAPRLPSPRFVPALALTLADDIQYSLPEFFTRGAGDTYFSGKMIAKLARILLIAEELEDLCAGRKEGVDFKEYEFACSNVTLPTKEEKEDAIARLRSSVEVWINGTAEAPFVYDTAWGGVVNCGCWFNGTGCTNAFPNCPAFEDQGLNFGNGFYNDQHFHYGYHIHGAAVVSHFDPAWGKKHFEDVLLLVRNIANPSKQDKAFPLHRHKDWYQGSSWASGVPLPPYLNGKNQESSSEAIASYESVALFGQVMKGVFESAHDKKNMATASEIESVGRVLAATELTAADKYWHIRQNDTFRLVPEIYDANVVGIVWNTMAQFGTWFGIAPYLPYGIQLLPLTPISEYRDELDWVNEMYYPFSQHCAEQHQCSESGWAILQLATLATVGYPDEAVSRMKELPDEGYENAGGNGHSKSNTLWYIATRPKIENPVPLDSSDYRGHKEVLPAPIFELTDCHTPSTCTSSVLDRKAGEYTCADRINWLIQSRNQSQWEACSMVGGVEFVSVCGPCDPNRDPDRDSTQTESPQEETAESECPACTEEQCNSDLNRCPLYDRTFVCTSGISTGGCSGSPWPLFEDQCSSCCEMTKCQKLRDEESKKVTMDGNGLQKPICPPCDPSVCYSKLNRCPVHTAPYLCLDGKSEGGCSSTPWLLAEDGGQCESCCEVVVDC